MHFYLSLTLSKCLELIVYNQEFGNLEYSLWYSQQSPLDCFVFRNKSAAWSWLYRGYDSPESVNVPPDGAHPESHDAAVSSQPSLPAPLRHERMGTGEHGRKQVTSHCWVLYKWSLQEAFYRLAVPFIHIFKMYLFGQAITNESLNKSVYSLAKINRIWQKPDTPPLFGVESNPCKRVPLLTLELLWEAGARSQLYRCVW